MQYINLLRYYGRDSPEATRKTDGKNSTRLTLPVAPQHASLASSMTTLRLFLVASLESLSLDWRFNKCQAALAPVIPLPMTATSTQLGMSLVVRWAVRRGDGLQCQKEWVETG